MSTIQELFVGIVGTDPVIQGLAGGVVIAFLNLVGAVLVFVWRNPSQRSMDAALGGAAGVMLAASFTSLILPGIEAEPYGGIILVMIGLILGVLVLDRADPGPEHANPMGTLHGGVLCDIGDLAMGAAYGSTLGDDESFTTLELDVKFRRPVWEQPLTATGEVMDAGRTVGLVTCDITGPEGELVAHLQSVCLTLRGESAKGR